MKPKRLLPLGVLLVGVTAANSLFGAQKPAPPQPAEQQKLKEQVDTLGKQVQELKEKSADAAKERAYVERIQKEAKDYYDKVLDTEKRTIEIVGGVLTVISGFIALFGFRIFDRFVDQKLKKVSADLRTDLATEYAGRMKQLEDDSNLRGEYAFQVLQARTWEITKEYAAALDCYRDAARVYKRSKPRELFTNELGPDIVQRTFSVIEKANPDNFREAGKEELANELYDGLGAELAQAALQLEWLAPLVRDRKPGAPAAQPATAAAVPATAQKSPAPAPDKTQPAKLEQSENK